jgi:hypothetical protein
MSGCYDNYDYNSYCETYDYCEPRPCHRPRRRRHECWEYDYSYSYCN